MPILRPTPSWSVFERRSAMITPCRTRSMSVQLTAQSSDRRNPPANPIKRSARSRMSLRVPPDLRRQNMARSSRRAVAPDLQTPRLLRQVRNVEPKRLRDALQNGDAGVSFAQFDAAQVGLMDFCFVGQFFLRDAPLSTRLLNVQSHPNPDVHSPMSGARLLASHRL